MQNTPSGLMLRTAYALAGLFSGLTSLLAVPVMLLCALLCLLGVGLVIMPKALGLLHEWASWHQRNAASVLRLRPPMKEQRSHRLPLRQQFQDQRTWQELGWLPIQALAGVVMGLIALAGIGISAITAIALAFWWTPLSDYIQFFGLSLDSWGSALVYGGLQLAVGLLLWALAAVLAGGHARLTLILLAPAEQKNDEETSTTPSKTGNAV